MVDLDAWYEINKVNPKNRGIYLLMVGMTNKQSGHLEIGVIKASWNGHNWGIKDKHRPMKWKYERPGEIDKYPDFDFNNRRISIND